MSIGTNWYGATEISSDNIPLQLLFMIIITSKGHGHLLIASGVVLFMITISLWKKFQVQNV